jgi:TrmH family RNA methyltransferase
MLRSALGLGAAGVVALKGTAELTSPKVVRGSMGALFRLPAVATDAEALREWSAERGVELWTAAADGEPLEPGSARGHRAAVGIVVGNEGAGVSPALEGAARRRVAIRLAPGAESLNVAIAAAILLREVARVD